jgi:hypothetical protein
MNDANPSWTGVLNAKMQTISETELYNKFDTELKNGDFFLKDYSGYLNATTNEFDKGTYQHNSTKTEVNCQDLMLDPWIVEIMSNQRTKNSKCTVPLVYITLKGKTAPEADQVYFLYNETYLGFIPLEKDENTYSKVVYKSKGGYDFVQDSKKILAIPRYANFCKEVVEHSFKVNAETLAAWSLIDDTTDLLSKGNLKFKNGQTFPYSVDQLRAIRAYCPDIDKTINDFVRQEDADFDNDKPQKTVGCKVLKGMKNDIKKGVTSVDIPPAYASRLSDSMKYDLSDVCSGSSAKLKLKGAIRDIDNLLFSSSLAGHKKSDYSTSYRLNLDAINEVSNDIVSNTASDNEDKDKDNSTKTRKKCKSNDATWGKRLLCAAGSAEGITAITTAALGGFTLYWNVKQWKAELAFQKEQFEDGQCAPYKGDVSNTLNLNLGGSTTTPMSMYAFCKLAASGALAFMNPCTALSAEGAPAQAISRCYGIYTNMNSGMVNYGNLPPTAAATTSAATGATGTTAATGAKDAGTSAAAAAPSSAGTNAGAAASPTDKKSKSFDSLYPSPYYPQTAVKSTAAYPYQYEPQGTTAPSTAAANKVAAKTSTVRGATIGEQVAGHMRTIQSTILSK